MSSAYNAANASRRNRSLQRAARARDLAAQGWDRYQIAAEIGVGDETVRRMLKGTYRSLLDRISAAARRKAEAKAKPDTQRHTVAGIVRGCPTTVTANTTEEAQRMLGRMAHG